MSLVRLLGMAVGMAAAIAGASACTPHQAYRVAGAGDYQTGAHLQISGCLTDRNERSSLCPASGGKAYAFDTFFVEFDDQGWLWGSAPDETGELPKKTQLEDAVAHINDLHGCRDAPIVVAFAHGWNHDASADDDNVEGFLDSLAYISAKAGPARKVVGVYLGWRGESGEVDGLKHLGTFFSRKGTAHRIGVSGVSQVLNSLELEKQALMDERDANCSTDAEPNLVFIGHSFGGAMIHSAMTPLLAERMRRLAAQPDMAKRKAQLDGYADLVILFNPAFEAARVEHITHIPAECGFGPCRTMLMAITSETDWEVGRAFPWGRAAGVALEQRRDTEQWTANVTAIGRYEPYITHDLSLLPDDAAQKGEGSAKSDCASTEVLQDPVQSLAIFQQLHNKRIRRRPEQVSPSIEFCGYLLAAREGHRIANPRFVNILADREIIHQHRFFSNQNSLTRFAWDYLATVQASAYPMMRRPGR